MKHTVDPDILASNLSHWGWLARQMPPAWDGAGISQPIGGADGFFGRMMPGKGLLLASDFKNLSLTKQLPWVYERSPFMRLADKWSRRKVSDKARDALAQHHVGWSSAMLDRLVSERGAITSYDNIIAARSAQTGAPLDIVQAKPSVTTVANQWHSLAMLVGQPAAMTVTANPGAVQTNTNAGSFGLGWPAASNTTNRYLISFGYTAAQALNMTMMVDILVAAGPFTLTSSPGNLAAPGNTPALTRYTSGAGVQIIMEVTTGFTGTSATFSFTYNAVPTASGHTTPAVGVRSTAAIVSMLQPSVSGTLANNIPFAPLAAGDYGVTAVTAITEGGSLLTGSSAANLYLYFPLMFVPGIAANMYLERDSTIQIDGLTQLAQDTSFVAGCIVPFVQTNTTSTGAWTSFLRSCVG